MNEKSPDPQEWNRLLAGVFDGTLSADDEARLAALLEQDPARQEEFVRACELDAMLSSEPESLETLSRTGGRPENVVSLEAGAIPPSDMPVVTAPDRPKRRGLLAAGLAAVLTPLAVVGILWSGGIFPDDSEGAFAGKRVDRNASAEGPFASPDAPTATVASADAAPADAAGTDAAIADTGSTDSSVASTVEEAPEDQYQRAILANLGPGSQQRPPSPLSVEPSVADAELSYNRHIRPILSENCFSCHGPDEHSRKADLRLDTMEGATDPSLGTIVPGEPEQSELVHRIRSSDSSDIMPPPESHKSLTLAEIDLLTRWIEKGAVYEEHWAFRPIEVAEVPEGSSPVDHFVDRRLEGEGLVRSETAAPEILIRRLYLDLIGLPPTPEEVAAFVRDPSDKAYAALVDDLLARPAFGEHRARYWLDAARYADTHGLHLDNYREMWPYRDWVIDAFNENKPFDEFTIEQLGGDLLPEPTQDQQVATGFNRCNVTTSEGGAIEEEFLVRYAVDRVSTTSTVWLGLSAGCAQCHDHKFDPLTMKDFYGLFAFFNNTTQPGMDGNAKDSPPVIRVYASENDRKRARQLESGLGELRKQAGKALAEAQPDAGTVSGIGPDASFAALSPEKAEERADLRKNDPFTIALRYRLPAEADGRVPLLRHVDEKGRGWRVYWENRGLFVELVEEAPNRRLKTGTTRRVRAGSSGSFAVTYDGSGTSNGIELYLNGAPVASRFRNSWVDSLIGDFDSDARLEVAGADSGDASAPVNRHFVDDRFLAPEEIEAWHAIPAALAAEKKPAGKRSDKEKKARKQVLLAFTDEEHRSLLREIADRETELSRIESRAPTSLVMAEKTGSEPMAHVLMRGEYDQKGEEVAADFPEFLRHIGEDLPKDRLGLARWLMDPEHPLTARVAVNRIWQELFGIGLVKTAEDFGVQGENPSHPELLDRLAADFIASGWDVKALYRTLVLSETYRQSSVIPDDLRKRDPENRLLARGPRFRLDAEVIRDQALEVAGLLDETMGGPGVRPYQPDGIWKAVGYTNSNTQTFSQDFGEVAESRRSIYTFWKRTAHAPNLAIFDAPNRESCIMRRERTNTPLQALVMMNDPQFVRTARHLARRVLETEEDRSDRLDRMSLLVRGRALAPDERKIALNSLDQFRNVYESDTAAAEALLVDEANPSFSLEADADRPAPELAAWTMVASQFLNLDEVLTKN